MSFKCLAPGSSKQLDHNWLQIHTNKMSSHRRSSRHLQLISAFPFCSSGLEACALKFAVPSKVCHKPCHFWFVFCLHKKPWYFFQISDFLLLFCKVPRLCWKKSLFPISFVVAKERLSGCLASHVERQLFLTKRHLKILTPMARLAAFDCFVLHMFSATTFENLVQRYDWFFSCVLFSVHKTGKLSELLLSQKKLAKRLKTGMQILAECSQSFISWKKWHRHQLIFFTTKMNCWQIFAAEMKKEMNLKKNDFMKDMQLFEPNKKENFCELTQTHTLHFRHRPYFPKIAPLDHSCK